MQNLTTFKKIEFNPRKFSNLSLWLKSDSLNLGNGDSVSSWIDFSGNGNNATQNTALNKPIFVHSVKAGKPVIRFDGLNSFMSVLDNDLLDLPNDFTIFFVARMNAVNSSSDTNGFVFMKEANASNGDAAYGGFFSPIPSPIHQFAVTASNWASRVEFGSTSFSFGSFYIISIRRVGTSLEHRTNSSDLISPTYSGTTTNTTGNLTIGGYVASFSTVTGGKLNGDIAELLIFNSSLSNFQLKLTEDYLNKKWQIF